jgi:hypothetical protein
VEERDYEEHRDRNGRFTEGNPGGGRPKGARNKLGEAFFEDLEALWARDGDGILKEMAANDPGALAKMVAALQPKQIDAQLDARLSATQVDMLGVEDD